jgi:hypothetical protein
MYDTTVICTYMDDDVILESDGVNDDEASFIRSCIYRQELLNIFCLEEFNESEINKQFDILYEKAKGCVQLEEFFNDLLGFTILYSYDYLYLIHPLICELLETGTIKTTAIFKAGLMKNRK